MYTNDINEINDLNIIPLMILYLNHLIVIHSLFRGRQLVFMKWSNYYYSLSAYCFHHFFSAFLSDIPMRDDLRWKPHFEHLHKLDSLKSSFTGGEMRYYIHKSTKEKVLARCIFSRESAWFEKDIYTKCQHPNILLPLLYFESPLSNFIILPE